MNKPTLSVQAKRMLAAVEGLLGYYRGGYKKRPMDSCPLCDATPRDGCPLCPWQLFEGEWCADIISDICDKRLYPKARWRAASIKRLTRWARLIRNGTYDKKLKGAKP